MEPLEFDTNTFEASKRWAYWEGYNAYYGLPEKNLYRTQADDNPFDMQCQPELYHEWHRGWKFARDSHELEIYGIDDKDDEEFYYGSD